MTTNPINEAATELIQAAYLLAGAPEAERQMLDFSLSSLKVNLTSGFKENATPMPSAAVFVEKALALATAAEIDVDQDETEENHHE